MTDGKDGVRKTRDAAQRERPFMAARRSGRGFFKPPRSFRRDEPDAAQRYRAQSGRGQIFLQFGWYHGMITFVPTLGLRCFIFPPKKLVIRVLDASTIGTTTLKIIKQDVIFLYGMDRTQRPAQ